MKIILVNKFFYPRGGDCVHSIQLKRVMEQYGHEVAVFSMQHPMNIENEYSVYWPSEVTFSSNNPKTLFSAFQRPFGVNEVKKKWSRLLTDFKPDVVHLHNIHSQLSPIIAQLAKEKGVPVVWTIHDYKLLCPRYDCLRNGKKICEKCFKSKYYVLRHKCMKNSLIASLIAYFEAKKWSVNYLESLTDYFVCPSFFMKTKMIEGGFSQNKLIHLCNFFNIENIKRIYDQKDNYYCYIGRLSHEKGLETLLKAATKHSFLLKIIGDGPLFKTLTKKYSNSNIEFLGHKSWDEIKEIVGRARFSVIPSEWYENNPLSIIEAQCLGTPVLGANIGGIPELIIEGENGLLFESGNVIELTEKIDFFWNSLSQNMNYKKIAKNAQEKYNSEKYYNEIIKIYKTI